MYLYLFVLLLVVGLIALSVYLYKISFWGGLRDDYVIGLNNWVSSFECGFMSHGFSEKFFSFSYLNLLVFFVVFDLEVSLLLKISFDGLWFNRFFCYMTFILLVFLSYVMEVNYGYIKWVK